MLYRQTFEHGAETKAVPVLYSAVQFPVGKGPHAWDKRPGNPGLKWYQNYDAPDNLKNGKIIGSDYIKQDSQLQCINSDQNKNYQ